MFGRLFIPGPVLFVFVDGSKRVDAIIFDDCKIGIAKIETVKHKNGKDRSSKTTKIAKKTEMAKHQKWQRQ